MLKEITLNKIILKYSIHENFKEKKTWYARGLCYFPKLYLCGLYRL